MPKQQKREANAKSLADIFSEKEELLRLSYLKYQIKAAFYVETQMAENPKVGKGGYQRKARAAIESVRKATEDLHWLWMQPFGHQTALRLYLVKGWHQDIVTLPWALDAACDMLEECRQKMTAKSNVLSNRAIANLVAYIAEKTGRPHHPEITKALREFKGLGYSEGAHLKWYRRNRKLIESQRKWVREYFIPNDIRLSPPPPSPADLFLLSSFRSN